jgi:hypothetical protein
MAMVGGCATRFAVVLSSFCIKWAQSVGKFAFILSIFAFVLGAASISISAELSRLNEYEIKAAFLYNFIKFTEWPTDGLGKAGDAFVIGVLGKDPFGAALDNVIAGETFHNRKVIARRFTAPEEAANSDVLFISASEESNLAAILKRLDGHSILTISDMEKFVQRGGMINLKKENNRVVFEINLDAAKRGKLEMNAQLLALARTVIGKP